MAFKDQLDKNREGFQSSIFASGVKFKLFSGDGAISFRILPAFNEDDIIQDPATNENIINPCGWIPFMTQESTPTDWGAYVNVVRFFGHGNTYKTGARTDFVTWDTFNPDEIDNCPYRMIYKRAQSDPDFKSMTEDIKSNDGKQVIERSALLRPTQHLVMNIVDMSATDKGTVIGFLPVSASKSLITSTGGLVHRLSGSVTDEQLKQDYLHKWYAGDITNPATGVVLTFAKDLDSNKGALAPYIIDIDHDATGRTKRWPLNPMNTLLAGRYYLSDPTTYMRRVEKEEAIGIFVKILDRRLPNGHHEYALLKEVFSGSGYENLIPNIPSAPGLSRTVQGTTTEEDLAPQPMVTRRVVKKAVTAPAAVKEEQQVVEESNDTEQPAETSAPVIPKNVPGTPIKSFDRTAFLNRIKGKS